MWIICSWQCGYKDLQLKQTQNRFQFSVLHLKFGYISPDFKGYLFSLCHHMPAHGWGKKEPVYFPSPWLFLLTLFSKEKVNREGWNCSQFLFIGKHTEKEMCLVQTFAFTLFITKWYFSPFGKNSITSLYSLKISFDSKTVFHYRAW